MIQTYVNISCVIITECFLYVNIIYMFIRGKFSLPVLPTSSEREQTAVEGGGCIFIYFYHSWLNLGLWRATKYDLQPPLLGAEQHS